jgi:hypothetical protein
MILPVQDVSAMMSPGMDIIPDPQVVDNPVTLEYDGNPGDAPHDIYLTRVADVGVIPGNNNADSTGTVQNDCEAGTKIDKTNAGDGDMWELRDTAGTKVVEIHIEDVGDTVSIPFGTGADVTITVVGNALTKATTSDGTVTMAKWVNITPLGLGFETTADNTDTTGNYRWASCGVDGGGPGDGYERAEMFSIELPVGGELLPISMAVLLVNGVSQSALWLIPLVAGAAITLIGFQVHKKQHKSL